MGFIHVTVEISNPSDPENRIPIPVLVDTGATLSVLPTAMLERLGILRIQSRRIIGFGGEAVRDIGIVRMGYLDAEAGVTVAFGIDDDPPIMGVTALEVLGFSADPVSGRLDRVNMIA